MGQVFSLGEASNYAESGVSHGVEHENLGDCTSAAFRGTDKGLDSEDAQFKSTINGTSVVLDAIRHAQNNGYRKCPPISVAMEEIRRGRKRSHWIWYVWPSWCAVRPHVRYPQFLLPDLNAACEYLGDVILAQRLVQATQLATRHLRDQVAPEVLFGKMHEYDFPKFRETLSLFAVAALLRRDEDQMLVFLQGLSASGAVDLDARTLAAIEAQHQSRISHAAQQVQAKYHSMMGSLEAPVRTTDDNIISARRQRHRRSRPQKWQLKQSIGGG
eukprot:gnl/MRDRNA2_/MRDRNA2_60196_c0_seq1.p1 gnl/MRDRNA2_/MRDRNA2_60196_c0~~gnl/MRDRNA2_/MRDRNA2_60196_c0_seq1.p1  ORF type:complete len:272 (-),score=46.69 gnl/MRDRNA2_/MRDRNA2_60196_c0_seq1:29-844(-)